jgi:hypothetical protein
MANTGLGNLKTGLSGSYHAFGLQKYAARNLGAFAYRFNRRFDLHSLTSRLLVAAVNRAPARLRSIRVPDGHCESRREITGWAAPVAGGPRSKELTPAQRAIDQAVPRTIAMELGHARSKISSVYVGR